MGIPAVSAARIYRGEKLNQSYSELPFSFEEFPYSALIKVRLTVEKVIQIKKAISSLEGEFPKFENQLWFPRRSDEFLTSKR